MKPLALGIAILCASAMPAAAQHVRWEPSASAEKVLHQVARCVVAKRPDQAQNVILSSPETADAPRRLVQVLTQSGCTQNVGISFKMHNNILRGQLAEQLYLASGEQAPVALPIATAAMAAQTSFELGKCVAARDPVAADAFVRSARRSREETAAFQRIVPAINSCAGHAKLSLSGAEIHGVIAEGLYRMRGAAAQGSN